MFDTSAKNRASLGPYQALLFDMDGTILTSIPAVKRCWGAWAARHGLDAEKVLETMHGRRAEDSMGAMLPPGADVAVEAAWLDALELEDMDGISEIAGAGDFLRSLPPDGWAIVTSANRLLAERRIAAAGLPMPALLVSADDVARGKPDPSGYLMAARAMGVDPARCLVLEDTVAGLTAGRAAGASVVQIIGTETDSGTVVARIDGYANMRAVTAADGIRLYPGHVL